MGRPAACNCFCEAPSSSESVSSESFSGSTISTDNGCPHCEEFTTPLTYRINLSGIPDSRMVASSFAARSGAILSGRTDCFGSPYSVDLPLSQLNRDYDLESCGYITPGFEIGFGCKWRFPQCPESTSTDMLITGQACVSATGIPSDPSELLTCNLRSNFVLALFGPNFTGEIGDFRWYARLICQTSIVRAGVLYFGPGLLLIWKDTIPAESVTATGKLQINCLTSRTLPILSNNTGPLLEFPLDIPDVTIEAA